MFKKLLFLLFPLPLLAQPEPVKLPLVLSESIYYSVPVPMYPVNEAFHPIGYLGLPPDTLELSNYLGYVYPKSEWMPGPACVNRNPGDFHTAQPGDLTIVIYPYDTTWMPDMSIGQDTMTFFKSFPVIVANQSTDTLVIGTAAGQQLYPVIYENLVGLILEGKDDTGQWRALETPATIAESDNALALRDGISP